MKTVTVTVKMSTWSRKTRSGATTPITNINFNTEEEGHGKGGIQDGVHNGVIVK